jgi:NADH dehydrogenase/NADH:ubiquinone oxidoreductase subunit G
VTAEAIVNITLDGRAVQAAAGTTVLETARAHGVAIPTLCYHEALKPWAACRLCVVELAGARGGKLVTACAQPCEEGQVILTASPRVQAARRATIELLMASGAHLPLVQALARAEGVVRARFTLPSDDCILCGLCVRACDELVGARAISLVHRGLAREVAPPFEITAAACIGCATCVLICPTGAIRLDDITPAPHAEHDARTCRVCGASGPPAPFADVAALFAEPAGPPAGGPPA